MSNYKHVELSYMPLLAYSLQNASLARLLSKQIHIDRID